MGPTRTGYLARLLRRPGRLTAIEEFLDADRRAVAERVAEIFRWVFLFVLAINNNFGGLRFSGTQLFVNLVLLLWAIGNLVVTGLLTRGYKPGPAFGLLTMVGDIVAGSLLVYFSNGLSSPYVLALFLAIIASAVRFGLTYSMISAVVIAFVYLFIGGAAPSVADFAQHPQVGLEVFGRVFLFFIVALVTGLVGEELIRERRLAISRAAQAEALQQMSSALAYSLDVNDLFEVVLAQAVRITSAESGALVLSSGARLQLAAYHGRGGRSDKAAMAKGDALIQKVLDTGTALHIHGPAHPDRHLIPAGGPKSVIVVPIPVQHRVAAVIRLSHYGDEDWFTDQQFFLVNALAGSAAGPLSNSLRYERKTKEAITDGLTGLLNHREFRARLDNEFSRYRRRGTPFSLMLIDIDHFKTVNDSMGHRHGDEVLRAAADLVRGAVRDHDLVARYGGDEIAVILPDAEPEQARTAAERMVTAVRRARIPATSARDLTFTIGVGSCPSDAVTTDEVVMAADQALYFGKRAGRDRSASSTEIVESVAGDPMALLAAITESGPQMIVAIARSMDALDPAGSGHTSRISTFAEAMVRQLGRPEGETELIRAAALLHETGRLLDGGPLGQAGDWADVHAVLGEEVIRRGRFLPEVLEIVRHHHERWDGRGLPDGLAGENIPQLARVLAVAEIFEELTRGGASPIEALEKVSAGAGKFYDPSVVDSLANLVGQEERIGSLMRTRPRGSSRARSAKPVPEPELIP